MWIFLLTLALAKAQEFQTFQTTTSLRRNYNPIQLVNWKWNCDADYKCRRIKGDKENKNKQYFHYIEGCKSVCGLHGSLWPRPTGETKINHELEIALQQKQTFFCKSEWCPGVVGIASRPETQCNWRPGDQFSGEAYPCTYL